MILRMNVDVEVEVDGHGRVPCSVRCGGPMIIHDAVSGDPLEITADEHQVVSVTFMLDGNEITAAVVDDYIEVVDNRLVSTMFLERTDFVLNRFGGVRDREVVIVFDGEEWSVLVP